MTKKPLRVNGPMRRIVFLIFVVSLFSLFPMTSPALPPSKGGEVSLYSYYSKEAATIPYRDGKKYLPQGLNRISRLFRSRDSDKSFTIDTHLIEILDLIEDHFQVRQIEIISGYRSRDFNRSLKAAGHKVANESLHTQGMAADIHLDEITEEALRDYALSLKRGGVGYYPSLHMVHVDTGPVRYWEEAALRKAWVGERNDSVPLQITVSPDRTLSGQLDLLKLESLNPQQNVAVEPQMDLEFFDRGQWKKIKSIEIPKGPVIDLSKRDIFQDLAFGKYRLKATVRGGQGSFQYSNEFYLKKQ